MYCSLWSRAERIIRHKAAVHYVNVEPVGASYIDGTNLVSKIPKSADKMDGATTIGFRASLTCDVIVAGLSTRPSPPLLPGLIHNRPLWRSSS
jgi:hypothetical protein